jgi:hypothetical protein
MSTDRWQHLVWSAVTIFTLTSTGCTDKDDPDSDDSGSAGRAHSDTGAGRGGTSGGSSTGEAGAGRSGSGGAGAGEQAQAGHGGAGAGAGAGGMSDDEDPEAGSGGDAGCGDVGQACCDANSCKDDLTCLNDTSCGCAKTLFGRYLLRTDSQLLLQSDPPATTQTAILDANTAKPLASVQEAVEGPSHGCALLSDKTVWCWRALDAGNSVGQLGGGSMEATGPLYRATKVLTAANSPLTNVSSLATTTAGTGGDNTCAVTAEGKIYCWGNVQFLLNNGTKLNVPYATPLTSDGATPFAGVVQASIDNTFGCALVQGTPNEVWCWGSNQLQNLATGDKVFHQYPVKILGLTAPTQVLAFGYYGNGSFNNGSVCVLDDGNVRCWGSNNVGQIGNESTDAIIAAPTLVKLMGGGAAISDIERLTAGARTPNSGYQDVCALKKDHSALCWGSPFAKYPAAYPLSNIEAFGSLDGSAVRLLTRDGVYHYRPNTGLSPATRAPNCKPLE